MASLIDLSIGADNLESIAPLSGLKNLRNVTLRCPKLKSIEGFAGVSSTTKLTLENSQVTSLKGIENMSNLERVSLGNNHSLVDIEALRNKNRLEYLDLSHCKSLGKPRAAGKSENR